ncbi:MAG: hypothetical protein ACPG49_09700 [Chitinophagales bacterium]
MKISLFLLITTLICLYFNRVPPTQSISIPTSVYLNEGNDKLTEPIKTPKKTKVVPSNVVNSEESVEIESLTVPNEETEEYLEFVRKQMQESIKEHLQNIQEKLGEEYKEQAEKLILM